MHKLVYFSLNIFGGVCSALYETVPCGVKVCTLFCACNCASSKILAEVSSEDFFLGKGFWTGVPKHLCNENLGSVGQRAAK